MSSVSFVGDPVSGVSFRPLGVDVREAENAEAAFAGVEAAVAAGCSVLFITEECATWAEERLNALRAEALPAVCILPGVSSPGGVGLARLKRSVEKALGSSLVLRNADALDSA